MLFCRLYSVVVGELAKPHALYKTIIYTSLQCNSLHARFKGVTICFFL